MENKLQQSSMVQEEDSLTRILTKNNRSNNNNNNNNNNNTNNSSEYLATFNQLKSDLGSVKASLSDQITKGVLLLKTKNFGQFNSGQLIFGQKLCR